MHDSCFATQFWYERTRMTFALVAGDIARMRRQKGWPSGAHRPHCGFGVDVEHQSTKDLRLSTCTAFQSVPCWAYVFFTWFLSAGCLCRVTHICWARLRSNFGCRMYSGHRGALGTRDFPLSTRWMNNSILTCLCHC